MSSQQGDPHSDQLSVVEGATSTPPPPPALPGQDLKPTRFLVNEADTSTQSAQASIERKYSTLHTCGTKVLPCEEDGVVVVLGMVGVVPLLRVGPSAHLFQAARWVATLNQADGLREA